MLILAVNNLAYRQLHTIYTSTYNIVLGDTSSTETTVKLPMFKVLVI
jgi:hypothetical protein